jgi:hypothetical protein
MSIRNAELNTSTRGEDVEVSLDHPPNAWKDFWILMGTISIGLLIALGLEVAVEWRHRIQSALRTDRVAATDVGTQYNR